MIYPGKGSHPGFANRCSAWECAYSIAESTGWRQKPVIDWGESEWLSFPNTIIGPKPANCRPLYTKQYHAGLVTLDDGDYEMADGWDFTREYQKHYLPGKRPLCRIRLKDEALAQRIADTVGDYIGVHIRRGDYKDTPDGSFPTQAPYRVPTAWFVDICERLGGKFYLSSDGTDDELGAFVARFNPLTRSDIWEGAGPVRRSGALSRADVIDLFALAGCRKIVCSISTWSMFAAQHRNVPYVWPMGMGQEI